MQKKPCILPLYPNQNPTPLIPLRIPGKVINSILILYGRKYSMKVHKGSVIDNWGLSMDLII